MLSYFQLPSFAQTPKPDDGTGARSKQKSQSNLWKKAVLTVKMKTAFEPTAHSDGDRKCMVDVTPNKRQSFFGGFFKRSYNKIAATSSNDPTGTAGAARLATDSSDNQNLKSNNYKPDLRVDTTALEDIQSSDILQLVPFTPVSTAVKHEKSPLMQLESIKGHTGDSNEFHRDSFTTSTDDDSKEDPTVNLIPKTQTHTHVMPNAVDSHTQSHTILQPDAHASPNEVVVRSILRTTAATEESTTPVKDVRYSQPPDHSPIADIETGKVHRGMSNRRISFHASSDKVNESVTHSNDHHGTTTAPTPAQAQKLSVSHNGNNVRSFYTPASNKQQLDLSKITVSNKAPIFGHLDNDDENPLGLSVEDRNKIAIFQDKVSICFCLFIRIW